MSAIPSMSPNFIWLLFFLSQVYLLLWSLSSQMCKPLRYRSTVSAQTLIGCWALQIKTWPILLWHNLLTQHQRGCQRVKLTFAFICCPRSISTNNMCCSPYNMSQQKTSKYDLWCCTACGCCGYKHCVRAGVWRLHQHFSHFSWTVHANCVLERLVQYLMSPVRKYPCCWPQMSMHSMPLMRSSPLVSHIKALCSV